MARMFFRKRELEQLSKRIKKYEMSDEAVDKALKETIDEAKTLARSRFNPVFNIPNVSKGRITTRKSGSKKKPAYQLNAGNAETGRYFAYTEWGTRNRFNTSNLNDIRSLVGKTAGDAFARNYKRKRLVKPTNLDARPFFYNSVRDAVKNTIKRLKKNLK